MPRPAPRRLALEPLADRIVPAFDLTIDGNAGTANVDISFDNQTGTTFTAADTGATLDVADIAAALDIGHVTIVTGDDGAEPGDIFWFWDDPADDLNYFGPPFPPRTLTLQPSASADGANVTLDGLTLSFAGNLDLLIDTTQPAAIDGDINLTTGTAIGGARQVTLSAGTGAVQLGSLITAVSGPVLVIGTTIFAADTTISSGDFTRLNGDVDLSGGGLAVDAGTTATLTGAVDGFNFLALGATAVSLGGAVSVDTLTFTRGVVSAGANPIAADTVNIGDGFTDPGPTAVLEVVGPLTAAVVVNSDGALAPGGTGVVGILAIDGNLTFNGGAYRLDVGPASDQITVTADVAIEPGSIIGDPESTGRLAAGDGEAEVIHFDGDLTGTFANAPAEGAKFLVETDALQLTNYGPADTGVTVRQAPREVKNTATGSDVDGTGYTIKMTGPGDLVRARDAFGGLIVVTRDTTDKSNVSVTTKANASDDLIGLAGVYVNGRLGTFAAKKANLDGPLWASGSVKAIALANGFGPIILGGGTAAKTAVALGTGFSDITTPGTVSLTTTGFYGGTITANAVGAVKVGGTLFSGLPGWDVAAGIASISAADIQGLSVFAGSIGTLTTTGSTPLHLAGDIAFSIFTLTGSTGGVAMKTLTAKGTVRNSQFNVNAGSVSAVTVGRFIDSQLYLHYTPGTDFTNGTFGGQETLSKFTTTAKVLGDAANPLNWAFAGSQVAAPTLGTVRLSGLKTDNGGAAVGFKFATAGGSVQTTAADDAAVPLKTNLTPDLDGDPTELAGDFFYVGPSPV